MSSYKRNAFIYSTITAIEGFVFGLDAALSFGTVNFISRQIVLTPSKWKGKLVSMTQINIVIGLSAVYFINYLFLQATNSGAAWVDTLGITTYTWRWVMG